MKHLIPGILLFAVPASACSSAVPDPSDLPAAREVASTSEALAGDINVRPHFIVLRSTAETDTGNWPVRIDQILHGRSGNDNGLRDVFQRMGVDFDYNPASDLEFITDNALRDDCVRPAPTKNTTTCYNPLEHPGRLALAAKYRGKMVFFLRPYAECEWVPPEGESSFENEACKINNPFWVPVHFKERAAGAGGANYVVATGDNEPSHYAHEAGHYFSLKHTHASSEGLADTPADPGASVFREKACAAAGMNLDACPPRFECNVPSVVISGKTYTPDKNNVMSYYGCIPTTYTLSPQQQTLVRNDLNGRHRAQKADYEDIGGPFSSRPTPLAVGPNDMHVFAVRNDGTVWGKSMGSVWWPSDRSDGWVVMGGTGAITGTVSACSWGPGRIDMVARTNNNRLYFKTYNGAWWPSLGTWHDMGGTIAGSPKIISWGPGRLDIFARNSAGKILQKSYEGGWMPSETTWTDLGGTAATDPTVVSWGSGRLDLFMTDSSGALWHKAFSGGGWWPSTTGWSHMGNGVSGAPTVVSWGPERLDIFVRHTSGNAAIKSFSGGRWWPSQTEFYDLGGPVAEPPTAISWGPDRIDVYARSPSNTILGKSWTGSAWSPSQTGWYTTVLEPVKEAPAVESWGPDRLDLFMRTSSDTVAHRAWNGSFWWPRGAR